ncbi:hypothetical protein FEZ18_02155 [Oceanihabitans sp. IOP_32]|uniref:hypothetical protein n=1 Tax=Oceanihabitans sp. IOP_32 TaxID=2529032 RepID=UPI0012941356|nr:hypothetical protein [Oceanihabitans sp. IOP_32]QFZ53689.1 hypothetical protein FEZ18_02155 [Oceanihabitans sp. IOP_32]
MDYSMFLAKFWGWYLIIYFTILSFNPKRIKQFFVYLNNDKFLIISSFLAIMMGLINILLHNVWEFSWKLIITIIAWSSLVIGLSLFIFPRRTIAFLKYINVKWVQVIYTLLLLVGLYLLNVVYNVVPV